MLLHSQNDAIGDGSEDDIAALIYNCTASVSADITSKSSSASLAEIADASLIYLDLDNERPVIIGGGGHAYVCDGFDGDYVHYNFGWEGLYNGYYRKLILPEIEANGSLHINSCIIGVTP